MWSILPRKNRRIDIPWAHRISFYQTKCSKKVCACHRRVMLFNEFSMIFMVFQCFWGQNLTKILGFRIVEIHRSRGAPLKDYILPLQKIGFFSILSLWWLLAQNKCHQRVFQLSGDGFYFWVFQNRLSSRKVTSVYDKIWSIFDAWPLAFPM